MPEVDPRLFFDPAAYEREREASWFRSWLVVGHVSEVPAPGHYFTWEHTGVPLIVVRSADGDVRAFFNSCRHRGAPVVREARGRNRALRCQYHSWTYDTFGRLVSAPDERDFVDLKLEERPLVPVQAKVAGGWVMVNQDLEATLPEWDGADSGGLVVVHNSVRTVAADWKVAAAMLSSAVISGAGGEGGPGRELPGFNGIGGWLEGTLLAAFAWPAGPGRSSLQVLRLVPAWDEDEEDEPREMASWRERPTLSDRAGRSIESLAEQEQRRIAAVVGSVEVDARTAFLAGLAAGSP